MRMMTCMVELKGYNVLNSNKDFGERKMDDGCVGVVEKILLDEPFYCKHRMLLYGGFGLSM